MSESDVAEYFKKRLLFTTFEKEKEWEALEEPLKKYVLDHIEEVTSKLSTQMGIETLCHALNEVNHRLSKVEEFLRKKEGKKK